MFGRVPSKTPAEPFFQYRQHIRLSGLDAGLVPDLVVVKELASLPGSAQESD
jgi:hypothetical protein